MKMRKLNFVNQWPSFLLILVPLAAQGCFWKSSDSSGDSSSAAKASPVDQNATPQNPTAVASTCGHSKYYFESDNPGSGIVNGVTARQNEYPWIAKLIIIAKDGSGYLCGGSVISTNYVITAAHCVNSAAISNITVYLGEHDRQTNDTGEVAIVASSWTSHSSYKSNTKDYDYALVKLSVNVTFNSWFIQPICLPADCNTACTTTGSTAYIAGWGTEEEGGATSRYLRRAYLEIANWNTCKTQYSHLTDRMICAGYLVGGVDACQGDSGGPLMSNENGYYKLCGLTSFGNGCARAKNYGVYSNVCKVLSWIKTTAGIS